MIDEHVYPWCGDLNDTPYIQLGMTLRDYFAATALQGLLCAGMYNTQGAKTCALESYEIADAMLKAR